MQANTFKSGRVILAGAALYLVTLVAVVGYTAGAFGNYYTPPDRGTQQSEDQVLQLWTERYEQRYGEYRGFLRIVGLALAICLGLGAAALGVWRHSLWQSLIALAAGGAVTVIALSLLPWVYFPFDQYPVSALWIMGTLPVTLVTWLVALIAGRMLLRGKTRGATA